MNVVYIFPSVRPVREPAKVTVIEPAPQAEDTINADLPILCCIGEESDGFPPGVFRPPPVFIHPMPN